MANVYGYARVSSWEQNLERQMRALLDVGVEAKNIFSDKELGKNFDRSQYKRLI